jgi:AcrR family transcriptional regulator
MGTQERKERERDEQRARILEAAGRIVAEEGVEKLSIRKIAALIEYSPGNIYHYFESKEEILEQLLEQGYRRIMEGVKPTGTQAGTPAEAIKQSLRQYMELALHNPDLFKSVMLNSSPRVLEHTAVLFQGVSEQRQTFGMLCKSLRELPSMKGQDEESIELTAQVLWSATFGLVIRLIIENTLPEEQKRRLIERHLEVVLSGLDS